MKFKFLKIVLTGLIVLASASIKNVNAAASPILSTFEWEGTCYDCNGSIGVPSDPSEYTTVYATLTLQDFEPLSTNSWDQSNFVSFAYTAGSNHVYDFLVNSSQIDDAYGTNATVDKFDFLMTWTDFANDVEKVGGYSPTQQYQYAFAINYDPINALNTWSISTFGHCNFGVLSNCADFGSTQTITTNASAPPSIFILALGLMGLSFRRSKKQV
jgi:hypothetical protein